MLVAVVLVPHRIVVWTAYVIPPVRLVDFIVGMMVGIAFLRRRDIAGKMPGGTIPEVAAIVAVAGAILASTRFPEALRYALFLMPFWALLIWVFVWQQGAISQVLAKPLFVRLGEASFAFYLVHWTVIQAVGHTVGWHHAGAIMALTLAGTIGLSLLLFSLVEQPLRYRIRTALSTTKAQHTVIKSVSVCSRPIGRAPWRSWYR